MKRNLHLTVLLTLCSAIMLHTSCKNNTKKKENGLEKAFALSQKASDYKTSTVLLTQMFAKDSIKYAWAADTLAYYHYLNANMYGDAAEFAAARFFIQEGLAMNQNNKLLTILDCETKMQKGEDSMGIAILNNAYNKTKNQEYKFYLTGAYILTQQREIADSLILEGLSGADSLTTMVSVQNQLNRTWQRVPKKAVYLFQKANYVFSFEFKNDRKSAAKGINLLKECLRVEPNFLMASAYASQVSQQLSQMGF